MTTDIAEYDPEIAEQRDEHLPAVKDAGECRTESVAKALDAAYSRASMLELTPNEAKALAEDFEDEAFRLGAGGDPDLIYIEHAYLRQRLNSVLGVGAAVPIRRREWKEQFHYEKYSKPKTGFRVYVDLVLIVRGCVVGEAIGDACYYPDNAKTNYSDALESAKSNALRRCCKEFGIGLQAWMKGWVEGWKERNPTGKHRAERPAEAKRETVPFAPPPCWPDCEIHDFRLWIDSFRTSEEFKVALGMFVNEPSISQVLDDWETILHHLRDTYKAKYAKVGTKELNDLIKSALDKLELDKQAIDAFSQGEPTVEAAAE